MRDPDPEMNALAADEYVSLLNSLKHLTESVIPSLLIPPSQTATLSAALELKAGVGGQEACIFLSDLLRMYMRHANSRGWDTKVLSRDNLSADGTSMGGVLVEVLGEGAYDELRWESGVHRIQRVPVTDTAGRVHTSTVAIAVSRFFNCVMMTCELTHGSFIRYSPFLKLTSQNRSLYTT